jgi:hypothetical protein
MEVVPLREGIERRIRLEKNLPVLGRRSCASEIVNDCLTDFTAERLNQRCSGLPLCESDDAVLPVDVFQAKGLDVAASKPQSAGQEQDREVSLPNGRGPVHGAEQSVHVLGPPDTRDPCISRNANSREVLAQLGGYDASHAEMPEKAADVADDPGHRGGVKVRQRNQEGRQVFRLELVERPYSAGAEKLKEAG